MGTRGRNHVYLVKGSPIHPGKAAEVIAWHSMWLGNDSNHIRLQLCSTTRSNKPHRRREYLLKPLTTGCIGDVEVFELQMFLVKPS